jgi:signal transduction protein with GAF and PtsI domain
MGVDALSMSPASFGRIKLVIRAFTLKRARALADQALGKEDEGQVRSLLNDALKGAGILKHSSRVEDRAGSDAGAFAG